MKALMYTGLNKMELREIPLMDLGETDVKVELAYCAICASDAHLVQGFFGTPEQLGLSMIPIGHEASGTIVEVGEKVEAFGIKAGDKVAVNIISPSCNNCRYCKKGLWQFCENKMEQYRGLFAPYCVTDVGNVHKIPDDMDLKVASLIEPLTIGMRAMDFAGIAIGQTVAISGCGGIGMTVLQLVLKRGGAKVTLIDPVESKRQTALELGANYVIDPGREDLQKRTMEITDGFGYDVVLECSGSTRATEPCLKMVAKGGKVIYVAVYPSDYFLPVNLLDMYFKEASIQAMYVNPFNWPKAVELMPLLKMEKLIGKVMPLSEFNAAFNVEFPKAIYPRILLDCQK
jgi:2-desacetyl-2-hydroxyethyl bacteriochlorophyllide A dehydrogenase